MAKWEAPRAGAPSQTGPEGQRGGNRIPGRGLGLIWVTCCSPMQCTQSPLGFGKEALVQWLVQELSDNPWREGRWPPIPASLLGSRPPATPTGADPSSFQAPSVLRSITLLQEAPKKPGTCVQMDLGYGSVPLSPALTPRSPVTRRAQLSHPSTAQLK